jgi:hypothetical protein
MNQEDERGKEEKKQRQKQERARDQRERRRRAGLGSAENWRLARANLKQKQGKNQTFNKRTRKYRK